MLEILVESISFSKRRRADRDCATATGIIHNVARIRPQAPNRVIGANGEAVVVTQETALGLALLENQRE